MVRRPFNTRHEVGNAFGVLAVRIALRSSPDERVRAAIDDLQQCMLALANAGALCGAGIEPERSSIASIGCAWADTIVTLTFAQALIDARSVTVVANLVHRLHDKVAPVSDLQIVWDALGRLADPTQTEFPAAYPQVPFAVKIEQETVAFDIVLDFAEPQPLECVESVKNLFAPWFAAINHGAYGDDSLPPAVNRVAFSTEPVTVCEEALVWYLDRFASTPNAIDGLINIACRVHRTSAPVAALTVEE